SWLLAAHDPSRHGVRGPRNAHPSPPAVSQTAPARRLLCLHVLWQRLPAQPCGPPCLSPGTRDPLPASTPGGMIPVDSELQLVLPGKSPWLGGGSSGRPRAPCVFLVVNLCSSVV